jgi:hypothetical protein
VTTHQATLDAPHRAASPPTKQRPVVPAASIEDPDTAAAGPAWIGWMLAIALAAAAGGLGAAFAAWVLYWPALLGATVGVTSIRARRRAVTRAN